VRGVALDGLDQVGDEVVTAFQLHVDAAPGFLDLVAARDHRVPDQDVDQAAEQDERDDDDDDDDHRRPC